MHILHVFPTFGIGGAQVRTVAVMNALAGEHSHAVIALDGDFTAANRLRGNRYTLIEAPRGRGRGLYVVDLSRAIVRERPDLVLTYNWGAIEAAAGALMFRLCPVVHTEDGFGPDEARSLKRRRVWIRRAVLKHIYCTVVPSKTLLRLACEDFRLPRARIRFVPNGVDTARFSPGSNEQLRKQLGVKRDEVLFGFVGQLRREKNLSLLLRAFAAVRVKSPRLLIVGDGPCRDEIQGLSRELGISDRVICVGSVIDPVPYLQSLDVFVMSSVTEQMPCALLEAMSCGLPAVCTDVGDTAELLGTRSARFVVEPEDSSAFTVAMRMFAENADLRVDLGRKNRHRCTQQYGMDRMIAEYAEVYAAAAKDWRRRVHRRP